MRQREGASEPLVCEIEKAKNKARAEAKKLKLEEVKRLTSLSSTQIDRLEAMKKAA